MIRERRDARAQRDLVAVERALLASLLDGLGAQARLVEDVAVEEELELSRVRYRHTLARLKDAEKVAEQGGDDEPSRHAIR